MPQQIFVDIPKKGLSTGKSQIRIETKGFQGVACKDATEMLVKLGQVTADEETAEMHETLPPNTESIDLG